MAVTVLAIDPGVAFSYWAIGRQGLLTLVGYADVNQVSGLDRVIVERPEYQGARSDAAQIAHLIDLAWSGARAAYSLGVPVIEALVHEWKGDTPKPVHHMRLRGVLTVAEKQVIERAWPGWEQRVIKAAEKRALKPGKPGASYYGRWEGHNALDAVALLMWHFGRLNK